MTGTLRLGTRGSQLALIQSEHVAGMLRKRGFEVELVTVLTEGDRRAPGVEPGAGGEAGDRPDSFRPPAGGESPPTTGVFVTALEQALAEGEVDLAVHSAKDVPLETREGLVVAAFPDRADPRDALVTASGGSSLDRLPRGASFGTDSPRRAGFVLHARPDLRHRPVHGNVDTRLRRLDEGMVDALVIAAAGLDRLGLAERIDQRLAAQVVAPAPGQGALAVQCRARDARTLDAVQALDDPDLRLAVAAERRVLEVTGGSCRAPVGALASVIGGRLCLLAAAAAPDGSERWVVSLEDEPTEAGAVRLAEQAGRELMQKVVSLV